jgi:hypothetical protein
MSGGIRDDVAVVLRTTATHDLIFEHVFDCRP